MNDPPLCPECWGLDIESHKCPEENFPGENKNQSLRNYMKKKAQNEWKELIQREKTLAECTKEMDELKECESLLNCNLPKLLSVADSAEKIWSESLSTHGKPILRKRIRVRSQFEMLEFDIDEIEEHIVNSIDSGLQYPSKKDLMFRIFELYDQFRIANDRIITLIENLETNIVMKSGTGCTCLINPTIHCYLHPSRDWRKHFTGIDGTMGMYNNDEKD